MIIYFYILFIDKLLIETIIYNFDNLFSNEKDNYIKKIKFKYDL